ncbi:mitochondrial carrier-like 2 isoform X1, partial [Silurus asotus]
MAETCGQVLLGSGLTVLSHPLMYIKILVQVGHEPLPPTLGRNLFGRQVQQLPGLFAYAKHIIKIDGKAGLFKGLGPRLCAGTIGTIVHGKVLQVFNRRLKIVRDGVWTSRGSLFHHLSARTEKSLEVYLQLILREGGTSRAVLGSSEGSAAVGWLITLRCMVQFIGRETKYSGVFDSIITIYREDGILGFFAGLIPRLLGDIFSLWICNMLAHFINSYALDDSMSHTNELKNCSQAATGFFASMLTYPFVLVSNMMAINNCGLAGGLPPYAESYHTWIDCWRHLSREGNMSRGNSLFFRKVPAGKLYSGFQKRFL